MPNPKRRVNRNLRSRKFGRSRIGEIARRRLYTTLSEVEDSDDQKFLLSIAHKAAINAINENIALNIPVTTLEGDWVVKKTFGGKVERVARIQRQMAGDNKKALIKGAVLYVKSQK